LVIVLVPWMPKGIYNRVAIFIVINDRYVP